MNFRVRNEENKVTYGNLAYKYDYRAYKAPEKHRERINKSNVQEKRVQGKASSVNRNSRKKAGNKISYFSKVVSVIVTAAAAIFMIVQFVEVNETLSDLRSMQSQYAFEESVTAQKSFELEQSIDLSKIEEEATGRLGMKRPDSHQIVYVDVKQDDITEKTADEVEGFGNRVSKMFSSLISNIVEFFSI